MKQYINYLGVLYMKKLLTVLFAFLLLVSNVNAVYAQETEEPDSYELDPSTLNVRKIGELEEEEEEIIPEEPFALDDEVRVSIVVEGDSTLDAGYAAETYAQNAAAKSYRQQLREQQDAITKKIEAVMTT